MLVDCKDEMDAVTKEIFGAVLSIRAVGTPDEAPAPANGSDQGLTPSVFTPNLNTAMKAAREPSLGKT